MHKHKHVQINKQSLCLILKSIFKVITYQSIGFDIYVWYKLLFIYILQEPLETVALEMRSQGFSLW